MTREVHGFDDDEELFRRFTEQELDGDAVMESAIQLQGTSVERGRFATVAQVMQRATIPEQKFCGVVRNNELPVGIEVPGGAVFDFYAEDLPEEGDWHAEIRHRAQGKNFDRSKPKSSNSRSTLKRQLARRFRVLPGISR